MRRLFVAAAFSVALLSGATPAPAADVGANDDSAKYASDHGAAMYGQMAAVGLEQTVIGVRFKPSEAIVIQDKQLLDRAIPKARDAGLRVVLAVYPYPPREIEAGLGSPSLFAGYVSMVARAYPEVRQFVIGNEPNQPAFWRPQFNRAGANVSAAEFGRYLAAAYDALKAIDPAIRVVGIGLSPRGNDKPQAKNNISTSPVRFLRSLGAWYRRSGRTLPLMDSFSFHPYPNRATDPLERGYPWPNAGFVNLDRIKQALWDAFGGTPQPTTVNGLKLHLDEIGWQVDTRGRAGYHGAENVPVTDEVTQAAIYGDLIRRATCDPDVAEVSFFGFQDDGLRTGFQAALHRADGSARPAAVAVQDAIAEAADGCPGTEVVWTPSADVVAAGMLVATSPAGELTARIVAGEDARAVACVYAPLRTSGTDFACTETALRGLRPSTVVLPTPLGAWGRVEVSVEFRAEANRDRQTLLYEETQLFR